MGIQEDTKETKKVLLEIKELLSDQKKAKEKKFKYPFGKKVGKRQRKRNYVTLLILHENGICNWKKYQIQDQTILHDKIPRLSTTGHVMRDGRGNPIIILPNWSVEPFSPLEHYEKSMIDGSNKKGYQILMDRMEKEKVEGKKKIGKIVPWIIGIGLAGIILYAILSSGGGA